jgi:acetone carboxylase gamma subunit
MERDEGFFIKLPVRASDPSYVVPATYCLQSMDKSLHMHHCQCGHQINLSVLHNWFRFDLESGIKSALKGCYPDLSNNDRYWKVILRRLCPDAFKVYNP